MKHLKTYKLFTESTYSGISKSIGLNSETQVGYPTKEEAEELVKLAKEGDETAFRKLFQFQRFARLAKNKEEIIVSNIMYNGFIQTKELFS